MLLQGLAPHPQDLLLLPHPDTPGGSQPCSCSWSPKEEVSVLSGLVPNQSWDDVQTPTPGDVLGRSWGTEGTYPVHNEDLAEFPFLLQLPGGNGHRVKEAESPAKRELELVNAWAVPEHPFLLTHVLPKGWALPPLSLRPGYGWVPGEVSLERPVILSQGGVFWGFPCASPKPCGLGRALTWRWKDQRDVRVAAPQRSRSGDKTEVR